MILVVRENNEDEEWRGGRGRGQGGGRRGYYFSGVADISHALFAFSSVILFFFNG